MPSHPPHYPPSFTDTIGLSGWDPSISSFHIFTSFRCFRSDNSSIEGFRWCHSPWSIGESHLLQVSGHEKTQLPFYGLWELFECLMIVCSAIINFKLVVLNFPSILFPPAEVLARSDSFSSCYKSFMNRSMSAS